jgi:hypothetical protein
MRGQSITASVIERVARKTDRAGEHWLWQGKPDAWGYGRLSVHPHVYHAHRLAWEAVAGEIPPGKSVLHTCDIRLCVRNDDEGVYVLNGAEYERHGHLWLATRRENLQDMYAKGRDSKRLRARGGAHHNTRLTAEQVVEMKTLYATGEWSQYALGDRYGITNSAVWLIVHGRNWGHVTPPPAGRR